MVLDDLLLDPGAVLQYMEEYVNDGSPSGFTSKHRPSNRYSPASGCGPFSLYACTAPTSQYAEQFGDIPDFSALDVALPDDKNWIFLHPDFHEDEGLTESILSIRAVPELLVVPTSSGRTVQIASHRPPWYIKLSYPRVLGRLNRSLSRVKAFAGPEVSHEIERNLDKDVLPASLHILHESGGRAVQTDLHTSWGMVVREPEPRGPHADEIAALVPFFSLFSTDVKNPSAPSLLGQLVSRWGAEAEHSFKTGILRATVDSYFALITRLGLIPELNAQNILLGLDSNLAPVGIVLRDLMGVEKDLTLRRLLGLPDQFASAPYKCIGRHIDPEVYQIRHSFSFDFKLGEYVISPIVREACQCTGWDEGGIRDYIRGQVLRYSSSLPDDYFPTGEWYKHPSVMLDKRRPYVKVKDPIYRQ